MMIGEISEGEEKGEGKGTVGQCSYIHLVCRFALPNEFAMRAIECRRSIRPID